MANHTRAEPVLSYFELHPYWYLLLRTSLHAVAYMAVISCQVRSPLILMWFALAADTKFKAVDSSLSCSLRVHITVQFKRTCQIYLIKPPRGTAWFQNPVLLPWWSSMCNKNTGQSWHRHSDPARILQGRSWEDNLEADSSQTHRMHLSITTVLLSSV